MKIKYSKKLDPKSTKPTNDKDLIEFDQKLNKLSDSIKKKKLIKIDKCLVCSSQNLKKIFSSRKLEWVECFECGHYQKKRNAIIS